LEAHEQALANKIQRTGSKSSLRQDLERCGQRSQQVFENDSDHETKGAEKTAEQAGIRCKARDRMKAIPYALGSSRFYMINWLTGSSSNVLQETPASQNPGTSDDVELNGYNLAATGEQRR
jgi:hypothetical protein